MKKRFNWLGFILITCYLLVFIIVVLGCIVLQEPMKGLLGFIAILWGIALAALIPYTYLSTIRNLLPPKKEHTFIIQKCFQKREMWGDGYPLPYKVPILVFKFENGAQLAFHVSYKLYNSVQCGDTGTLIYKEGKRRTFFIDFMRD